MILVTGASGNTGRALVRLLAAGGRPVRALVRSADKAAELAMPNVQVVIADLAVPATLPAALNGIDQAYLVTSPHPQQVEWHHHFIEAARRAGVRRIVRHSVRGADPASRIKICRWHAESQHELEASGIAWTHLQPVYNMNNLLKLAGTMRTQGAFFAPMKDAPISMVDAADIAAVAAGALTNGWHEGKTLLVTGPEAIGFAAAAAVLSKTLGKPIRYVDVPPAAACDALLKMGMPAWYVDDLLGFYEFYSSGDGAVVSDVVPRLTGRPGRTFQQFAEDNRARFL